MRLVVPWPLRLVAVAARAVVAAPVSVVGGDGVALEGVEAGVAALRERDDADPEVVAVLEVRVDVPVAVAGEVLGHAADHADALADIVKVACRVVDHVDAGEVAVAIPVVNAKQGTVAVRVNPDGTEEIIKNSVPTEDGIQLTVNGGATVKIVDNSKDFIDTREHWSRDQVNFVAARELFQGVGDNQFGVGRPMTRSSGQCKTAFSTAMRMGALCLRQTPSAHRWRL